MPTEKSAPLTYARLAPIVEALTAGTMAHVRRLEQRLAALEAFPFEYQGTFDGKKVYKRNQLVTHQGSLWICRDATTTAKPGAGDGWQLCCKRGADGRDAKGGTR